MDAFTNTYQERMEEDDQISTDVLANFENPNWFAVL